MCIPLFLFISIFLDEDGHGHLVLADLGLAENIATFEGGEDMMVQFPASVWLESENEIKKSQLFVGVYVTLSITPRSLSSFLLMIFKRDRKKWHTSTFPGPTSTFVGRLNGAWIKLEIEGYCFFFFFVFFVFFFLQERFDICATTTLVQMHR